MPALFRLREPLALAFIALLPLHAAAVTVLTHVLAGAGHAPLRILSVWKELVLLLLTLFACVECARSWFRGTTRIRLDVLDWVILLSLLPALPSLVRAWNGGAPSLQLLRPWVFGFRYDFVPLLAFLVLRRVPWSREFRRSASWVLIAAGSLFAAVGIITLFLPLSFFPSVGYSDLHSLYLPGRPIAAFQFIEETGIRRVQSVMSGPNHFGLWLLLPLAAILLRLIDPSVRRAPVTLTRDLIAFVLVLAALALTFSRSAWIGALCMGVACLVYLFRTRRIGKRTAASILGAAALTLALALAFTDTSILLRSQSLLGHMRRPLEALSIIRSHPLGLGLGAAGPASNHIRDACIELPAGADTSWAKPHADLCVFVDGVQTLPVGRTCSCPLLTENWYAQWGVEMGVLGLLFSLLLVVLPVILWLKEPSRPFSAVSPLALLGVLIAGMFLHSFEDPALSFTLWILLASALPGSSATLRP